LQRYIPGPIKARWREQSEWLAELRRMTIMFIGIGGFDYEADNAVERLHQFLRATQEVIYRYEGSLSKVAVDDKGTVLLVLFGAPPFSHEDDTRRAVACGLGLLAVARDQQLRMSIGISEGTIFAGPVGAPSRQEYTVIGDEVNLASRLMQYGRAGSLIISGRVKERAGIYFVTEDLGYIQVKGKAEKVAAYLVTGEQEAREEFVTRYLLYGDPFIGRKAELDQAYRVAARARAGKLQVLLMEGELGLGKSRLAAEMVREWLSAGGAGYGSKCTSFGQQIPYQGWREVLAAIYGLTPGLSPRRQLARLAAGIGELPEPAEQPGYWLERLPLLADVLGLEADETDFTRTISGQLRRNNTFELIEAILRREAERRPLMILLEDVQWADELTLTLVDYLARDLVNLPLLLVVVYRPLDKTRQYLLHNLERLPYTTRLFLEALTPEESMDLVQILLDGKSLSPEGQELLLTRAQGNPFFLQEISRAILEVLEQQRGTLVEMLNLPDTVQDVILMRVDRLAESDKLTLKVASVIGTNFQRFLLGAVHPLRQPDFQLGFQLERLEQEKLIQLEAPEPHWEYSFRNVVTQEVVYEGLLLAQRRQLHAAVGAELEKIVPEEVERLAFHYGRSDDWGKALHYLTVAGRKAQREYANQAAIAYYTEILHLLVSRGKLISTDYWDILLERAKLYNLVGPWDSELEDLGTLGIVAEALNDDLRRALAAKQWTYLYESSGDYDSGVELIERAVQLAQQAGNEKLIGEGYNQWGKLLFLQGQYETAYEYLQKALLLAQNQTDLSGQADCLHNLGLVAHYQADYEVAQYFFREAIDIWRNTGDQVGLSSGLSHLGRVYYDLGRYAAARQCYDQALVLHRRVGDRAGEAATLHYLAQTLRSLGRYKVARELYEQALALHRSIGDQRGEALSLYQLGYLLSRLGDPEQGLTYLEKGLQTLRELNEPWVLRQALSYYGWTLEQAGQLRAARARFEEALKVARDSQQEAPMMEVVAHLGRVALQLRDTSLAETCARHALGYLERKGPAGIEHVGQVYLSCYQILQAQNRTNQAEAVLEQGRAYLATQVEQIDDLVLRHSYLYDIPEHRTIHEIALSSSMY
jgi:tetratricopeptide (TPR) repeat protein/class 3 adenylate cyclase